MISRRLTKTQKVEILEAYKAGANTNHLAKKYNCSPNTINRTVKTLLSEHDYGVLKGKRSRNYDQKEKFDNKQILNQEEKELDLMTPGKSNELEESILLDDNFDDNKALEKVSIALEDAEDFGDDLASEISNNEDFNMNKICHDFDNNFEEIAPLVSDFDFEEEKQKSDFEILNQDSLPDSVYMIVDKKVELECQSISSLPEWSFLPENELKRKAIILFSNQRSAKRSCSRNQRVIKVPNTSVFNISKPFLLSKGITRLILEDSIISIDS